MKETDIYFTDWASYDFTVSPLALDEFEKKYGYSMTAEDFVNKGKFHVTHMPGDKKKADWMKFINDFVIQFGKKLVKIVHDYGRKPMCSTMTAGLEMNLMEKILKSLDLMASSKRFSVVLNPDSAAGLG